VRGPFVVRETHDIRLVLPREYPFRPPQVTFLNPHLHPNIYPNGRLCWGIADDTGWWRGGDGLGTLVERLLQIVVGVPECTNPRSPANPDAVDPYVSNVELFPLLALDRLSGPPKDAVRFREIGP
jgi:ubiquitin-protein ligase